MTTDLDLDAIEQRFNHGRLDFDLASDALVDVPKLVAEVRRLRYEVGSLQMLMVDKTAPLYMLMKERDKARAELDSLHPKFWARVDSLTKEAHELQSERDEARRALSKFTQCTEKRLKLAEEVVNHAVLLVNCLPDGVEPMSQSAWGIATSTSEKIEAWLKGQTA